MYKTIILPVVLYGCETLSLTLREEHRLRVFENRVLGRPRRRWEDNIKMDLSEIGFGDVDWIHLAQDRDKWRAVVNTVMNLRVS
jgi:hypothetical protein